MASSVPSSLALTSIADGASIIASDHRNNYAAVQVAVNGLITVLDEVDAKGDLLVASAPDTFDNVGVGTNGQVLVADSTQTVGMRWATPSIVTIFDVMVGRGGTGDPAAPAAIVDSNTILGGNIPQTYKHLRLYVNAQASAAVPTLGFRLNNDSGASYAWNVSSVSGGVASASGSTTAYAAIGTAGSAAASSGQSVADILDYTSTSFQKMWTAQAIERSQGRLDTYGGYYSSSAAITRLQVLLSAGNLTAGTRVTLYGIN